MMPLAGHRSLEAEKRAEGALVTRSPQESTPE